MTRVPFFRTFNFNKETPKKNGEKGATGVPGTSSSSHRPRSSPSHPSQRFGGQGFKGSGFKD